MLSNAYFLAKFRFDTAENEPPKICKFCYLCYCNFAKSRNLEVDDARRRLHHGPELLHLRDHVQHDRDVAAGHLRALVDHAAQGRGVVEPMFILTFV